MLTFITNTSRQNVSRSRENDLYRTLSVATECHYFDMRECIEKSFVHNYRAMHNLLLGGRGRTTSASSIPKEFYTK